MQTIPSRLALLAGVGGLVLLLISPHDDVKNTVGVALLAMAVLLIGLGKGIDLLGYVREGATDAEEHP